MISLKPKKARVLGGKGAWWYDERGSISVYIADADAPLSCRIKRSALMKYLERSKKGKRK